MIWDATIQWSIFQRIFPTVPFCSLALLGMVHSGQSSLSTCATVQPIKKPISCVVATIFAVVVVRSTKAVIVVVVVPAANVISGSGFLFIAVKVPRLTFLTAAVTLSITCIVDEVLREAAAAAFETIAIVGVTTAVVAVVVDALFVVVVRACTHIAFLTVTFAVN